MKPIILISCVRGGGCPPCAYLAQTEPASLIFRTLGWDLKKNRFNDSETQEVFFRDKIWPAPSVRTLQIDRFCYKWLLLARISHSEFHGMQITGYGNPSMLYTMPVLSSAPHTLNGIFGRYLYEIASVVWLYIDCNNLSQSVRRICHNLSESVKSVRTLQIDRF